MPPSALRISIRTLPRPSSAQWICRRCLATETTPSPSTAPPLIPHRKVKDASQAENYDPNLSASQRDYRLTKTDFHLKKMLPHRIPAQYLQHSTSDILHPQEREQRDKIEPHKHMVGVVVRAGKMNKTVTVRVPGKMWNKRVKKHFTTYTRHKVHDPNNSLTEGDVIQMHRLRASSDVHHVVASIISPFGKPIEDRPSVPTPDERLAKYKEKRFAKLKRRSLRQRAADGDADAIEELRSTGLDLGKNAAAGKTRTTRTTTAGGIWGGKGQNLPDGVLPGGRHEVGKINERALKNKEKATKLRDQAEANLLEAKEKGEELESQGIMTETALPVQGDFEKR